MAKARGIVASGHVETSRAAAEVLRGGGNAFDAALAGLLAACIAEPVLVSLGGGGFMLARPAQGRSRVYDFFCQTPHRKRPAGDLDFYPILANFGSDSQQFHIGMGAMAVPGVPGGIFTIHRELGRMPLREIAEPAVGLARRGVSINALHAYIIGILEPILRADAAVFRLFESRRQEGALLGEGETFRNPDLGEAIDYLMAEGEALFYRGDWAEQLARDCFAGGGNLQFDDLRAYRVETREPLAFRWRDARCLSNPPPSPGGCLVAFAAALFQRALPHRPDWGDPDHVRALARVMRTTSLARMEAGIDVGVDAEAAGRLLGDAMLADWVPRLQLHTLFSRGTTHISVADRDGNVASLTASNGECNRYLLPATGIVLNNMLGEQDLHPRGFHRWQEDCRLASMMSPTVVERADGATMALGTGGSNRIRSAILQVLINVLDFGLGLEPAVAAPRLHVEDLKLSIEPGFAENALVALRTEVPEVLEWPEINMYFGGVHAVRLDARGGVGGAGDPRRGGAVEIA